MYNGRTSQLSTKKLQDGNNQFIETMKTWIKKYNDLLAEELVEEIELTGNTTKDGFKCQRIVEAYNSSKNQGD